MHCSALQLEDENEDDDDIHLSLSPATSPIPDEAVFDDVDLNSSKSVTEVPSGLNKYAVGYRDVRSAPGGPRNNAATWYDGLLGCLKPMMNFMNKTGKPTNLPKDQKGTIYFYKNQSKFSEFICSTMKLCTITFLT